MTWEECVFERMSIFWHNVCIWKACFTFFWQYMGMRAECLLKNGRFFEEKYAWEQLFFSKRLKKKGYPIDFFDPEYYSVVLRELTFFLTKYGHDSMGFFMKNLKKNDIREPCFWENGRFFRKYGHESDDFSVKNRKKRASYWLFWIIL